VNEHTDTFGTTCPASDNTCVSASCQSLSTIQTTAVDSGWNPTAIAESVLALMNGMGQSTGAMNADMTLAAMDMEGCNNCPTACTALDYSCSCSSPEKNEGFGVLQETWTGTTLEHASTAIDQINAAGQDPSVWFPGGITPCTILQDPGAAIAEFYWTALSIKGTNCEKIREWVDPSAYTTPCCAVTAYYNANPSATGCSFTYNGQTCNP